MVNLPVGRTLYYTGFSIHQFFSLEVPMTAVYTRPIFLKKVFYCSCVYTHTLLVLLGSTSASMCDTVVLDLNLVPC